MAGMLLLAVPAGAQTLPHNIPPGALNSLPPGAASMTPEQARAYYNSMTPAQKAQAKQMAEQAKVQVNSNPGLKDQLKAMYKSWKSGQ